MGDSDGFYNVDEDTEEDDSDDCAVDLQNYVATQKSPTPDPDHTLEQRLRHVFDTVSGGERMADYSELVVALRHDPEVRRITGASNLTDVEKAFLRFFTTMDIDKEGSISWDDFWKEATAPPPAASGEQKLSMLLSQQHVESDEGEFIDLDDDDNETPMGVKAPFGETVGELRGSEKSGSVIQLSLDGTETASSISFIAQPKTPSTLGSPAKLTSTARTAKQSAKGWTRTAPQPQPVARTKPVQPKVKAQPKPRVKSATPPPPTKRQAARETPPRARATPPRRRESPVTASPPRRHITPPARVRRRVENVAQVVASKVVQGDPPLLSPQRHVYSPSVGVSSPSSATTSSTSSTPPHLHTLLAHEMRGATPPRPNLAHQRHVTWTDIARAASCDPEIQHEVLQATAGLDVSMIEAVVQQIERLYPGRTSVRDDLLASLRRNEEQRIVETFNRLAAEVAKDVQQGRFRPSRPPPPPPPPPPSSSSQHPVMNLVHFLEDLHPTPAPAHHPPTPPPPPPDPAHRAPPQPPATPTDSMYQTPVRAPQSVPVTPATTQSETQELICLQLFVERQREAIASLESRLTELKEMLDESRKELDGARKREHKALRNERKAVEQQTRLEEKLLQLSDPAVLRKLLRKQGGSPTAEPVKPSAVMRRGSLDTGNEEQASHSDEVHNLKLELLQSSQDLEKKAAEAMQLTSSLDDRTRELGMLKAQMEEERKRMEEEREKMEEEKKRAFAEGLAEGKKEARGGSEKELEEANSKVARLQSDLKTALTRAAESEKRAAAAEDSLAAERKEAQKQTATIARQAAELETMRELRIQLRRKEEEAMSLGRRLAQAESIRPGSTSEVCVVCGQPSDALKLRKSGPKCPRCVGKKAKGAAGRSVSSTSALSSAPSPSADYPSSPTRPPPQGGPKGMAPKVMAAPKRPPV